MAITKGAANEARFRRSYAWFGNARAGFEAYLARWAADRTRPVLLPAYIGWSAREGSGVFDPIRRLNLPFAFYRVNERLEADVEHLGRQLKALRPSVLVVIHYFGRVDPGLGDIVREATAAGARVIEDEAHALFSDLVTGHSGRAGHAALFSLHKMLPVKTGGVLVLNEPVEAQADQGTDKLATDLWAYDLPAIAAVRKRNAEHLGRVLPFRAGRLDPLWPDWPGPAIPQSYPVVIGAVDRDALYETANAAGFGVVSLYHTLIAEIDRAEYPASYGLSRRIMNLPVHQDVSEADLDRLARALEQWT